MAKPLLFGFCTFLIGCTSMQFSKYEQAIKVTSLQPGAEIYYDGILLGVTPAFVKVRRGVHPVIELRNPGQEPIKYRLSTYYRWIDSFVPNLFGYVLAPVFLLVDVSTGTAWNLQNVDNVLVPGKAPDSPQLEQMKVAIAPPQLSTVDYSDQVGLVLQKKFADNQRWKIYPYNETLGVFEDAHYNFDNVSTGIDRNELFANLRAGYILESKLSRNKDKIDYNLRNIFSDQIEESGSLDLPPREARSWGLVKYFFIGLIPNSVTLDASSRQFRMEKSDGTPDVLTKAEPFAGWMGELSRFAGSFSFTNLIPPGHSVPFEAHARLVSSVDFNFSNLSFNDENFKFNDTKYRLSRGVVGIGPQFYLETVMGVFYLDIMLGLAYSRIKWSGPRSGTSEGSTVGSIVNIGYYRYLSNRLALRLFLKQINEDYARWKRALDYSQETNFPFKSLSAVESGVSLVFYWPEAARNLRQNKSE